MKFSFRKSDRDAIILLFLVIIVAVILFPLLGERETSPHPYPLSDAKLRLHGKKGEGAQYASKGENRDKYVPKQQYFAQKQDAMGELFCFDPNTADSTQLLRLGLRPWQVRNIYKYRSKGGRYRQKEDFAMLYGLTLEQYRRLEPYIRIKPEVMARDYFNANGNGNANGLSYNKNVARQVQQGMVNVTVHKLAQGEFIDINTADTSELKRIPGIGSYFARRIVELRQHRQAFVSSDELLVIRNFPESALTYMTVSQNFAKIHINKASLQQLKAHPLINHTQATDILKYRRLSGDIHSAEEMSNFPSFSEAQLSRLAPFLLFD